MNEFHLKNELLIQAFWGGLTCKNSLLPQCRGYFNSDSGDFGRSFVEYCVARIFNIHRVPGHEQYYNRTSSELALRREFGTLTESDINAACEEMEQLYHFVQTELKQSTYVKNGKIKLVRSLRPFEIEKATPQLLTDATSITLPVNIITSYAHDGELFCYGSTMSIVREVPVEQVFLFDECLFHPKTVCGYNIHGGEYEVWVVEDNMFGKMQLNRDCFKYTTLNENIGKLNWFPAPNDTDSSLYTIGGNFMRPCEWNGFTKWIIQKNREKIEELHNFSNE